jgi:hypothetical protein
VIKPIHDFLKILKPNNHHHQQPWVYFECKIDFLKAKLMVLVSFSKILSHWNKMDNSKAGVLQAFVLFLNFDTPIIVFSHTTPTY